MITEWKDLGRFLGKYTKQKKPIPVRTLQHWHYVFLELPIVKSHEAKQGRIMVEEEIAMSWFRALLRFYPNLAKRR